VVVTSTSSGATNRALPNMSERADRTWEWTTVGVHENVIEASWHALVDALTFGLAHASMPPS
jgi:2-isopropylmalate synthase